MYSDLERAGANAPDQLGGRYDACIFGSGPAGLTVALGLARRGRHVVLVEAGALEFSEQSQGFYDGTESGIQNWNAIRFKRLRFFGGTSGHWAGRCGIFDAVDFDEKTYHRMPGWPLSRQEMLEHLPEASQILDLGSQRFETRPLSSSQLSSFAHCAVAFSPPTRFGDKYRRTVLESPSIQLYTNANLTDLVLGVGRKAVDHAIVRNYQGRAFKLQARRYVVALGAVENARLLLSNDKQVKGGLGNHSNHLGRSFMEHLNVEFGRFVVRNSAVFAARAIDLAPTEAFLRSERVGNGVLSLDSTYAPQDYGRLKELKGLLRAGACRYGTLREFARKFGDFNCTGEGVITSLLEQAPNSGSHVSLTVQSDPLGMRRANLHWSLGADDRRTIRTLGLAMAAEMARLDIARVRLHDFVLDERMAIPVGDHAHHMGTTRMSKEAKDGVVDENCRVHSVDNLYVAGASTFPTGGGTSPTLTVVMLALRLAKHLASLDA